MIRPVPKINNKNTNIESNFGKSFSLGNHVFLVYQFVVKKPSPLCFCFTTLRWWICFFVPQGRCLKQNPRFFKRLLWTGVITVYYQTFIREFPTKFHQPRFPWNKVSHFPYKTLHFGENRSCEVAIIWPDLMTPVWNPSFHPQETPGRTVQCSPKANPIDRRRCTSPGIEIWVWGSFARGKKTTNKQNRLDYWDECPLWKKKHITNKKHWAESHV